MIQKIAFYKIIIDNMSMSKENGKYVVSETSTRKLIYRSNNFIFYLIFSFF